MSRRAKSKQGAEKFERQAAPRRFAACTFERTNYFRSDFR